MRMFGRKKRTGGTLGDLLDSANANPATALQLAKYASLLWLCGAAFGAHAATENGEFMDTLLDLYDQTEEINAYASILALKTINELQGQEKSMSDAIDEVFANMGK